MIGWIGLLRGNWILIAYWDLIENIGKLKLLSGNIIDNEYMENSEDEFDFWYYNKEYGWERVF